MKSSVRVWEKKYVLVEDYKELCYDLLVWSRNLVQGHCEPFIYKCICAVWAKFDQRERTNGMEKYFSQKSFMIIIFDPVKFFKNIAHSLYPKTIVGEVRPRFGKGNIIHGSGKNFTHRSTMTLSFDFKIWFNEQNIIHKVVSYCMFLLFSGQNSETYLRLKKFPNGCTSPRSDDWKNPNSVQVWYIHCLPVHQEQRFLIHLILNLTLLLYLVVYHKVWF